MSDTIVIEDTGPLTVLLTDKLSQYLNSVEEVINQYGGQTVDLGLNVLRIEAASELIIPIVGIIFTSIVMIICYKMFFNQNIDKETKEGLQISGFMLGILSIILFLMSLVRILNLWAWVGMFYPEMYAVHKLLLN